MDPEINMVNAVKNTDDPTPIAYSVADAAKATSLSRSYLYEALARGDLPRRKIGRRTVILRTDLEDLLRRSATEGSTPDVIRAKHARAKALAATSSGS
jgi:excisionase family DNA binding protein